MTDNNLPDYKRQPTEDELKLRETGVGRLPQVPVGELPAGGAKWPVEHPFSKIGIINLIARAYRWTHDEALRHSRQNARACLRDLVIRNALMARWIPVVQLSWHLRPKDPTDPRETEAAAKVTKIIERTPKLQDFFLSLLWAEWFGRQGLLQTYEWVPVHDEMWMVVREHRPVNGDSLVARWSGDWGQLTNGLWDGDQEITDRGFAHFYTPEEREAVIVHTAPPEDVDFEEPELAGQIKGSGLRGHVYWYWYLKSNFEALLGDFAERFAQGVWTAWYEYGNDASKTAVEEVVAAYRANRLLLFPRTQQKETAYGVDIQEVGTANPQFLLALRDDINKLIHEYITFGALNNLDVAVGGDGAGLVEDRISRGVKYSASRLAETLTAEWLPVLYKYNCPGVEPAHFEWDIEHASAGSILSYARAIHDLGGPIDLEHLMDIAGLPIPGANATVASKLQPLSPQMGQVPQGVPMAGDQMQQQPQPDQQQVQQQPPQQQQLPPNLLEQ